MYLELGISHISDFNGYDHILFLISLVAMYQFAHWKKLLKLITAFTLGHSISLALSALNFINFSTDIIELLIPVTIIITALLNIFNKSINQVTFWFEYTFAMGFGLIHGLGFSILLKNLLGASENMITPLLAFNIGLEIGQIGIVLSILLISLLVSSILTIERREWGILLSGISIGMSIIMIINRWIW
jgi:hypothetical protein